jgi:hypothetical protein
MPRGYIEATAMQGHNVKLGQMMLLKPALRFSQTIVFRNGLEFKGVRCSLAGFFNKKNQCKKNLPKFFSLILESGLGRGA